MARATDLFRDKPQYPNEVLIIELPLGISVNTMYVNTKRGGKRLSAKAEQYFYDSRRTVVKEMINQNWHTEEDNVWHNVTVDYFFPDNKKRDSHNYGKLLLDLMENLVYGNDRYVKLQTGCVKLDCENPRIIVTIEKIYEENGGTPYYINKQ